MDSYTREMKTILDEFAEPVPQEGVNCEHGWYLNHFPVLRPEKSKTPCRIVWNAAAVHEGYSLNDALHEGPDFLNNLFIVLLAWPQFMVGIVGRIRKMFNQVQIRLSDKSYHRFLWRNGDSSQPPKDYQWKRLLFEKDSSWVRLLRVVAWLRRPLLKYTS